MSYFEKYMKYKTKYLKLKELEKKLIAEGTLPPTYNTQTGGHNNKLCKKCNNLNKYCKLCNKNDILLVSKLTDTPKMMEIYGREYDIPTQLYNKLQSKKLDKHNKD